MVYSLWIPRRQGVNCNSVPGRRWRTPRDDAFSLLADWRRGCRRGRQRLGIRPARLRFLITLDGRDGRHQRRMHQPGVSRRGTVAPIDVGKLLGRVSHPGSELLMQRRQPLRHLVQIGETGPADPVRDDRLDLPLHAGRLDAPARQIRQSHQGSAHRFGPRPASTHRLALGSIRGAA